VALTGIGPVLADDGLPAVPVAIAESPPGVLAEPTWVYPVQPGDTLKAIARQVDRTVAALIAANPGINPDSLAIGYQLRVP
jgi:LysM repeat protein